MLHRCVRTRAVGVCFKFVWQASGLEAAGTVQEVQEPTTDKKAELGGEAGLYGDDTTINDCKFVRRVCCCQKNYVTMHSAVFRQVL